MSRTGLAVALAQWLFLTAMLNPNGLEPNFRQPIVVEGRMGLFDLLFDVVLSLVADVIRGFWDALRRSASLVPAHRRKVGSEAERPGDILRLR